MSIRFYVDCPLAPGPVRIGGAEAHHLGKVCRLRAGDQVQLFNGDGHQYPSVVKGSGRSMVELEVLGVESPKRELGFRLEVAAPLPKGDRAQFLIEKLTEMGVTSYVPLHTRYSVVHPREMKLAKLRGHVIQASKQCGRNVLLQIEDPVAWQSYCRRAGLPALRVLAHPGAPAATWTAGVDMALAVGPEGGFTEEEIELARSAGWQAVGLGPRMLRIETAALVLASWASSHRP